MTVCVEGTSFYLTFPLHPPQRQFPFLYQLAVRAVICSVKSLMYSSESPSIRRALRLGTIPSFEGSPSVGVVCDEKRA